MVRFPDETRPAMAGLVGGSFATLALHPLDLLKIRQSVHGNGNNQVARQQYQSMKSAVRGILAREGGLRGLYSGVGMNVLVSGSSWGIYFATYGSIKSQLKRVQGDKPIGHLEQLGAAFGAGVITTLVTNPMGVVRTRVIVSQKEGQYKSMWAALSHIRKSEGFNGLYKGLLPSLLGVSHGAIQFSVYEKLKEQIKERNGDITMVETMGACAMSKIIAALVTYPCQNLRACQQAQSEGQQISAMSMYQKEGIRGFYRGLGPYLLHVIPNVCMVFLVYEVVVNGNK